MGLRVSQIPAEKDKDLLSRVNMDAHACNHSTWEVEAGGSGVKSHSRYIVEGQPFCDPLKTKKKKKHRGVVLLKNGKLKSLGYQHHGHSNLITPSAWLGEWAPEARIPHMPTSS